MGRQKIIACTSRIESPEHGVIELFYQNEAISNVELKLVDGATRYFKKWLPGKMAEDVPFLVPRICGLCSAAHSICSSLALEDAYGIEVSEASAIFRRLMWGAETIRSHLIHVGILELPDIIAIAQGSWAPPSIQGVSHPVLRDFVKNCSTILQHSQRVTHMVAGGFMPVTNRLGGCFPQNFDKQKLGEVSGLFDKMRIQTRALTESMVEQIYKKFEPNSLFDIPDSWGYLAAHRKRLYTLNYDLRDVPIEGLEQLKLNQEKGIKIEIRKKGEKPVGESLPKTRNEFPIPEATKIFQETDRHIDLVINVPLLTGPYARLKLPAEQPTYSRVGEIWREVPAGWKNNALSFALLRLLEVMEIAYNASNTINAGFNLHAEQRPMPRKPKGRSGWAAVEAPRGVLIHNYNVSPRGYISGAKIYVPTDINLAAFNNFLSGIVAKLAGTDIVTDPQKILAILNIGLRAFDPCISCLAQ